MLDRSSFSRPPGEEDEIFHHFGRVASLVRSAAPYVKNAVMADSDASLDASTVDTVSDLFRVRSLQVCPGALSPAKRPRFFWAFLAAPCLCLHLVVGRWPHQCLSVHSNSSTGRRTLDRAGLGTHVVVSAAGIHRVPSITTPANFPQDLSHVETAALCHWKEYQYKFPPEVHNWDNGLVRSGVWRYPSSKEHDLIFGFRRHHTAAMSSSTQRV